jgi:hypothetical protein
VKLLRLSRDYFESIALPSLRAELPELLPHLAAGLVGNGSECFGYDDEISRDHDWGVDFFVWVTDNAQVPALAEWKRKLFENHPPEFPRTRSEYGARVTVQTCGEFYADLLGVSDVPRTLTEWRRAPEENFAMATNGAVFLDNAGEFTRIRDELLAYYPEDLRRKRISYRCMALAQTGQYNLDRCVRRGDFVTARTVLARFTDSAIAMAFLLNRRYRPYYKWAFRATRDLPTLGGALAPLLQSIAAAPNFNGAAYAELQRDIAAVCELIAAELRAQGLAASDDWFLTAQGEEVRASIEDEFLRGLPAQVEV